MRHADHLILRFVMPFPAIWETGAVSAHFPVDPPVGRDLSDAACCSPSLRRVSVGGDTPVMIT
jgi:hypothetical protein